LGDVKNSKSCSIVSILGQDGCKEAYDRFTDSTYPTPLYYMIAVKGNWQTTPMLSDLRPAPGGLLSRETLTLQKLARSECVKYDADVDTVNTGVFEGTVSSFDLGSEELLLNGGNWTALMDGYETDFLHMKGFFRERYNAGGKLISKVSVAATNNIKRITVKIYSLKEYHRPDGAARLFGRPLDMFTLREKVNPAWSGGIVTPWLDATNQPKRRTARAARMKQVEHWGSNDPTRGVDCYLNGLPVFYRQQRLGTTDTPVFMGTWRCGRVGINYNARPAVVNHRMRKEWVHAYLEPDVIDLELYKKGPMAVRRAIKKASANEYDRGRLAKRAAELRAQDEADAKVYWSKLAFKAYTLGHMDIHLPATQRAYVDFSVKYGENGTKLNRKYTKWSKHNHSAVPFIVFWEFIETSGYLEVLFKRRFRQGGKHRERTDEGYKDYLDGITSVARDMVRVEQAMLQGPMNTFWEAVYLRRTKTTEVNVTDGSRWWVGTITPDNDAIEDALKAFWGPDAPADLSVHVNAIRRMCLLRYMKTHHPSTFVEVEVDTNVRGLLSSELGDTEYGQNHSEYRRIFQTQVKSPMDCPMCERCYKVLNGGEAKMGIGNHLYPRWTLLDTDVIRFNIRKPIGVQPQNNRWAHNNDWKRTGQQFVESRSAQDENGALGPHAYVDVETGVHTDELPLSAWRRKPRGS
jgi:hypothetical protein